MKRQSLVVMKTKALAVEAATDYYGHEWIRVCAALGSIDYSDVHVTYCSITDFREVCVGATWDEAIIDRDVYIDQVEDMIGERMHEKNSNWKKKVIIV